MGKQSLLPDNQKVGYGMGLAEHTNSVRSLKFQPTQHIYSPHNMKQLAETKIDKKRKKKKKLRETRSNKHKKNQHNSLGNLHNCGRVQVDPSGFSLDTKSPSGFRSRISGRSMSWSSRWMAFLLKATDGNMRNYIIWCGLTTAPAKGRTKGHDRREEAKRHNCSTFATATATKGNKNNSWLPFVSEFHFIIAFIATFLKGGGGSP